MRLDTDNMEKPGNMNCKSLKAMLTRNNTYVLVASKCMFKVLKTQSQKF